MKLFPDAMPTLIVVAIHYRSGTLLNPRAILCLNVPFMHGPVHTRIGYISGGRGEEELSLLLPPPPTLDYNAQGCLTALLPLSSHKNKSLCGHEKYPGMLLILAQAGS